MSPEQSNLAEPEPWGMLDEAPLADRYHEDVVYVAARDPETLYVYWELTPETRERLRASTGDGQATLRLITVGHGEHGSEQPGAVFDYPLHAEVGSQYLPWQPQQGDILRVRAQLGVMAAGGVFTELHESPLSAVPPMGPADAGAPHLTVGAGHSPWRRREGV